jgi:signal transduction histidine kinase
MSKKSTSTLYCRVLRFCFFFIVLTAMLAPVYSHATAPQVIDLNGSQESYDLRNYATVLPDNGYSIEQVSSPEFYDKFQAAGGSFYPGANKSGYWLRFTVVLKDSSLPHRWIFEVVPPQIKKIILFIQNTAGGDWAAWHAGYGNEKRTSWRGELFLAHGVKLGVAPVTFYVFVQAEDSFFNPLLLVPENMFFRERMAENVWIAAAFGFAFALISYNLFLFGCLRDRSYLWYSLQGLSLAIYFLLVRGVVFQYVTIESSFVAPLTFAFLALFHFFSALFVRDFFTTAANSKWFKILLSILPIVPAVLFAAIFFLPVVLTTTAISVLNIFFPAVYLFLGSSALLNGYSPARFFLLAWTVLLIIAILTGFGGLVVVRSLEKMLVLLQASSLLELLLLSLALADRIENLRRKKYIAAEVNVLKSSFVSAMGKVICDPLDRIDAESRHVLESDLDSQQSKAIAIIHSSAEYLKQIVSDMADMDAIESDQVVFLKEQINFPEFISEIENLVRPSTVVKGLGLVVNMIGPLPDTITADPVRLRQILLNLLGNAVKFTNSGEVRLVLEMCESGTLKISVSDTGIGISPEKLETVFDSYYQTDRSMSRSYGGTGLGLAISKRLVNKMGGAIHAESIVGEGSCFSVVFPFEKDVLLADTVLSDVIADSVVD